MGAALTDSCFICRIVDEDTKGEILAGTDNLVLIKAFDPSAGMFIPDAFVIAPKMHYTSKRVLFDWTREECILIDYLERRGFRIDNDSTNRTERGGRTQEHVHVHALQRRAGDPEIGMRTLLDEHRRMTDEIEDLRRTLARKDATVSSLEAVVRTLTGDNRSR